MEMNAPKVSGCSIAATDAHQAPADGPHVAQDPRSALARNVLRTQAGTSTLTQVSTWSPAEAPPGPLAHSVSLPGGVQGWTMTAMVGARWCWSASVLSWVARS